MPPKRSLPTANPRTAKAYLTFKSDLAELIGLYNGRTDHVPNIIVGLEKLVHYEFNAILTKEMLKTAEENGYPIEKSELLDLIKKLRKWTTLKHASIWTGENYSSPEKRPARQAVADSVKMVFYEMYSYILENSKNIEFDVNAVCMPRRLSSSKGGVFIRDSEFDLYAKSAESEDADDA